MNWRIMAVFLGPRQTTAEEREGRRKPREMTWRAPIFCVVGVSFAVAVVVVVGWGAGNRGDTDAAEASPFCVPRPFFVGFGDGAWTGGGGRVWEAWTSTGSQPPGAWVILAASKLRRRGMEGPVRSTSRIPTEWPARQREKASCVVIEDLPTPPLPERI